MAAAATSDYSALSAREKRQFFVTKVSVSHKSIDDNEASVVEVPPDSTLFKSQSPTAEHQTSIQQSAHHTESSTAETRHAQVVSAVDIHTEVDAKQPGTSGDRVVTPTQQILSVAKHEPFRKEKEGKIPWRTGRQKEKAPDLEYGASAWHEALTASEKALQKIEASAAFFGLTTEQRETESTISNVSVVNGLQESQDITSKSSYSTAEDRTADLTDSVKGETTLSISSENAVGTLDTEGTLTPGVSTDLTPAFPAAPWRKPHPISKSASFTFDETDLEPVPDTTPFIPTVGLISTSTGAVHQKLLSSPTRGSTKLDHPQSENDRVEFRSSGTSNLAPAITTAAPYRTPGFSFVQSAQSNPITALHAEIKSRPPSQDTGLATAGAPAHVTSTEEIQSTTDDTHRSFPPIAGTIAAFEQGLAAPRESATEEISSSSGLIDSSLKRHRPSVPEKSTPPPPPPPPPTPPSRRRTIPEKKVVTEEFVRKPVTPESFAGTRIDPEVKITHSSKVTPTPLISDFSSTSLISVCASPPTASSSEKTEAQRSTTSPAQHPISISIKSKSPELSFIVPTVGIKSTMPGSVPVGYEATKSSETPSDDPVQSGSNFNIVNGPSVSHPKTTPPREQWQCPTNVISASPEPKDKEEWKCPERQGFSPEPSERPLSQEWQSAARQRSQIQIDLRTPSPQSSDLVCTEAGVTRASQNESDDLFDPFCDPAHPRKIQFQDISAAAFKIKSGIMVTPCTKSHLSAITGVNIYFKKEFLQITGSFKERGARYTLMMISEDQKKKGIVAASAGNHALALCYHGHLLGVPVTVVMPIVAPIMKVQACKHYGATILIKGRDIAESREHAMRLGKEKGLMYINGYDHPHILAGQGTMGLEIVEQVADIDAVVVPVGGGGLIAGLALAVKSLYPNIKVIGVESERCASFSNSLKKGYPCYTKAESTLADGLAVPIPGVNAVETAASLVDKMVVVKEEWIAVAILRLVEHEKAVVEGAGAVGLAALLAGLLPELKGKRVVVPLCGGNIDTTILGRCLERGLAADGRLIKFAVTVSDRPGGIAELCKLLARLGVSIKDIIHERAWLTKDIFSVEVKVVCETRDHEHCEELQEALNTTYFNVRFGGWVTETTEEHSMTRI